MTIPAIAPGERPPPPSTGNAVGSVLPLAVAGAKKGAVVVGTTVFVMVETPLLVGLSGAEKLA